MKITNFKVFPLSMLFVCFVSNKKNRKEYLVLYNELLKLF